MRFAACRRVRFKERMCPRALSAADLRLVTIVFCAPQGTKSDDRAKICTDIYALCSGKFLKVPTPGR